MYLLMHDASRLNVLAWLYYRMHAGQSASSNSTRNFAGEVASQPMQNNKKIK